MLISKSATIGAPFVNELEEPTPIVFIIGLQILTILIVLFTKSKEDLDKMEKVRIAPAQSQKSIKSGYMEAKKEIKGEEGEPDLSSSDG